MTSSASDKPVSGTQDTAGEPKLKRINVAIGYSADDGYRTQSVIKGPNHKAGLEAVDELVRVLTLFGHGDEAVDAAQKARDRTSVALRKMRAEKTNPACSDGE